MTRNLSLVALVGSLRAKLVNGAAARAAFANGLMEYQPVRLFGETLGFGTYGERMGDDGEIADEGTLTELRAFLDRFVAFCRS